MERAKVAEVTIEAPAVKGADLLLTKEALEFLAGLHERFDERRLELLKERKVRQKELNDGALPTLLKETEALRSDTGWRVAEAPKVLEKRWVEITGPTDRKMVINALNSGADIFMADFEDANSPTWKNMVEGQLNLIDAVRERIALTAEEGKEYRLNREHALLFVRPRGWHLQEKHLKVGEEEISASLFDFGLYLFHNAHELIKRGKGPFFYLPKLESHKEARLWNEIFNRAEEELAIPRGTIRATVLIETILAAFEIEEILYELKEHSAGCNAGRWDYIFSAIKKFRREERALFPDREQVTMTVPFMRAYTERLVTTCHKRGAHAIGGMAAFIPNRRDREVTEVALQKVLEDKRREAEEGFDGTWVAHPDLVAVARGVFREKLKNRPHQKERRGGELPPPPEELLHFAIEGGRVTEAGVRHNITVTLQYLSAWLQGVGAVALYNLMEDTATAEISRAQIWQWIAHKKRLDDGRVIDKAMIARWIPEELIKIEKLYGAKYREDFFQRAKELLEELLFSDHFVEFLTLPAYKRLEV